MGASGGDRPRTPTTRCCWSSICAASCGWRSMGRARFCWRS